MMLMLALGVVIALGAAMIAAGVAGVIRPDHLTDKILEFWRSKFGFAGALAIRLALGVALLYSASASTMPLLFKVLGVLALVGVLIVLLARHKMDDLIVWLRARAFTVARAGYLLGAVLGAVLIYAAT